MAQHTERSSHRSRSVAHSHRSHGHSHAHHSHHHHYGHGHGHSRHSRLDQDLHSALNGSSYRRPHNELARRHTSHDIAAPDQELEPVHPGTRSNSTPQVDMDLAYGEFHPSALERLEPPPEQEEVNGLVSKVKSLLEEAECAQHSATATIAHLQKNPDAMAAVALTLAEISNLIAKLAPAALTALKTSAPAVFALLASPQFMIAAGVGIGVTIVMFGGYKIVKQIQTAQSAKNNNSNTPPAIPAAAPTPQPIEAAPRHQEQSVDEMLELELNSSISRVEKWRRGVAESEAHSVGTSVDGEFITPTAAAMSGIMVPDKASNVRSTRSRRTTRTARTGRTGATGAAGKGAFRDLDGVGPEDSVSQVTGTTRSSRRSKRTTTRTSTTRGPDREYDHHHDDDKKSSKHKKSKKDKFGGKSNRLRLLFA